MKKEKTRILLTVICGLFYISVPGQVQRYPANISPIIGLPYSLFIGDYTDPGKQQLTANILFNDFNESQWTFKLRLRIENADLLLETIPGFTPSTPIVIAPGELVQFTETDWIEYLDYSNLNIKGPARTDFLLSGRLPEGSYTVTMQVLDYETGDPLSLESQFTWWMGLFSPPLLTFPEENSYIQPSSNQVSFLWQMFDVKSPNNSFGTEFQLTIWEINDANISPTELDPLTAVQNGQALQVFQSEVLSTNSFVYGPSEPALEAGKTYIYRVQALDPEGKDRFKNQGYSEFRRIFYGWPSGGNIQLKSPEHERTTTIRDQSAIQWYPPDNKISIQPVEYEIRIAEIAEKQSVTDALEGNDLWFYEEIPPSTFDDFFVRTIPPTIKSRSYAWEVIGHSDGQEVARSDQQVFYGPPLLEFFYAGVHRVEVTSINNNLNNLSGTGKVRLNETGTWAEVAFEGLKVQPSGIIWSLVQGDIESDIHFEQELTPAHKPNGSAHLVANKLKLNTDGLWVQGKLEWQTHLPVATSNGGPMVISTDWNWYHYNEYKPVGTVPISLDNQFDLLDPYGFRLELDTTSSIMVNEDSYSLQLDGHIFLPQVVTAVGSSERIKLPFFRLNQLYYFETLLAPLPNPLLATSSIDLWVSPERIIVDFSEGKSPAQFSNEPDWQGVLFDSYDLTIPIDFDPTGKVILNNPIHREITKGQGIDKANVSSSGMNLKTTVKFEEPEPFEFATFPSMLDRVILEIEGSEISNQSSIAGKSHIPVLSETDQFIFRVPMSSLGIGSGYFENLQGYKFAFNKEDETQRLNFEVKRAVLEDDERLSMTLDVEWPTLGIEMKNVKFFKVWGNYNIGFYTPEGLYALDEQLKATYKGYPVTVDALGAGRNSGKYGFGVSGKITLGDDVSGDAGPPSFNLYSIETNRLLPGDYIPVTRDNSSGPEMTDNLDDLVAEYQNTVKLEEESLNQSLDAMMDNLDLEGDISALAQEVGVVEYEVEDVLLSTEEEHKTGFSLDESTSPKQKLLTIAQLFDAFATGGTTTLESSIGMMDEAQLNESFEEARTIKEFLIKAISQLAAERTLTLTQPVATKVQELNTEIARKVNGAVNAANKRVDESISLIVGRASDEVISTISNRSTEAGGILESVAEEIRVTLVQEVQASISHSAYDNVTFPITALLEQRLLGKLEVYIYNTTEEVVLAALTSGQDPSKVLVQHLANIDEVLSDMVLEVLQFINQDNLSQMVLSLGGDAIGNIDSDRIVGRLQNAATKAIAGYAVDKIANGSNELINQALGEEIGIEVPLDVGLAAGRAIVDGDVKDVLADPVPVKLRSTAVDLNGLIWLTKDHPVYGDVFSGAIEARIKVPDSNNPFSVDVAYMNGRTQEGLSYWFIEAGGAASDMQQSSNDQKQAPVGADRVGQELSNNMEKPVKGINLGVMEIMAIRGRVYKHMAGDPKVQLVPDASNKFGAYLHLITFGPSHGERIRLEVEGMVNTFNDGNMIMDFAGNLQIDNQNPEIIRPDPYASIFGEIKISYNKSERHFFGYAGVELVTDGLCGEGSLLVDVKPSKWRVALGTREERLNLMLGCAGLRYLGWLDLNSESVEVGVGLGVGIQKSIDANLKVVRAGLNVEAYADLLVFASVNYKPLQIQEVGLFLEALALIDMYYKAPGKSMKYVQLVDIYVYGSSILRFNPKPTILYGQVKGRVSILQLFEFKFDKQYEVDV